MLRARTGRSPKRNTAQGSALGVGSLTNWRAVSAKGASDVFFSFLLRLQRANYVVHCYPGCYPGLYSYWAFSPSLLPCKLNTIILLATIISFDCCYTFLGLSARLCSCSCLQPPFYLFALMFLLRVPIFISVVGVNMGYVISDSFCSIEAYHESLTCGDKCCIFASSVREMTDLYLSY